ncbi:MAG: DNA mismatch repair protein MutS [Clostridiales bacterium]|nr:DNA mismatch repair protein MutS [Clostridiales bacterium]
MFEPDFMDMLEFPAMLDRLAGYMRTPGAIARALALAPIDDMDAIARSQALTASARRVLEVMGEPPIHSMKGLSALDDKLRLGETLSPGELNALGEFLNHCRLLKNYLKRALTIDQLAPGQGMSVDPMDDLRGEIERCLRGERLDDRASAELHSIRTRIEQAGGRIKEKLNSMLRAHPEWYQEGFYSARGDRYGLPVKREWARMVRGATLDISGSGATVFIEPEAVSALQRQADQLRVDEHNEEFRILSQLSAMAADGRAALAVNRDSMEQLDFTFACGRLAAELRAGEATVSRRQELTLLDARHPLLGDAAVPMSLTLDGRVRALIITGPNTGGKTVAIKTVGLIALMVLSGLPAPVRRAQIPMLDGVYCDIGDGQSLNQNLSTFSSHMGRVVRILRAAGPRSLVLLDEVGSGTDPQEGMGLAVAVLEELKSLKCLAMATSHYAELKRFAAQTEGFANARMTFDRASLQPTYHLELGMAGESCALDIARRLGMAERLLARARRAAYPEGAPIEPAMPVEAPISPPEAPPAPIETPAPPKPPEAPPAPQKPALGPGDRVRVPFMNCFATVVLPPNARGELLVRVRGKNFAVPARRVQPFLGGEELYPGEAYDLDIVLDSWENRKKRKQISKGKTDVTVEARPENR